MSLLIIEMIFDSFLRILFEKESFFHWAFGGLEPDCYGTIEVASGRSALFIPRISEQTAVYCGELATPEQFSKKYGVDETYYTDEVIVKSQMSVNYSLALTNHDSLSSTLLNE
ncbi:unnamed protein product [Trichobilharzia regenti]|nr:unnamed protein product [Trichobilharzia regenti]